MTNPQREKLIGLVGHPSCGKDTVAEYLVKDHGFVNVNMSDLIKDYILKNNLGEPKRELFREVAISLRKENGEDYLMKLCLQNEAPRLVVTGLRMEAEARRLQEEGGLIVACEASSEARFKRAMARGDLKDSLSFEEFKRQDEIEGRGGEGGLQVNAVIALADHLIQNDGTLEDLRRQIERVV
jgi:dephospho-CoA kinase